MDNHIITKFGTVVPYAYVCMCPDFENASAQKEPLFHILQLVYKIR